MAKWVSTGINMGGVSYRLRLDNFLLSITNQHINQPGFWLGSCTGLFDNVRFDIPVGNQYARDAQEMVMMMVLAKLNDVIIELSAIKTAV